MTHPDDDRLLEFVLQTLEDAESSVVRAHLQQCEQCRDRRQKVQRQIDRLGSVDIHIDVPEVPYPSHGQGHSATVWKWAAVLAAGFLTGFLTGRLVEHPRIVPVPQTLTTVQATTSSFGHVTCRAENLKTFRK